LDVVLVSKKCGVSMHGEVAASQAERVAQEASATACLRRLVDGWSRLLTKHLNRAAEDGDESGTVAELEMRLYATQHLAVRLWLRGDGRIVQEYSPLARAQLRQLQAEAIEWLSQQLETHWIEPTVAASRQMKVNNRFAQQVAGGALYSAAAYPVRRRCHIQYERQRD
jgi:sirohydrochlorin ferrochelatase